MYMFVTLCTTEAKLEEKKNLHVLENHQDEQEKMPTACLVAVGISDSLQFPRKLPGFDFFFLLLNFIQQNRNSRATECNRYSNLVISNSPATKSSFRKLPDIRKTQTIFYFCFFFPRISLQRKQNFI